ncbi:MAG TPA: hypothetical protein VGV85_01610 [Longimicrobiaceae bacterium]|nr:hypothetical protein [Longimicrobiaceae bacterium]
MDRNQRDEHRGPQPDLERESVASDDRTGTDYSSRETDAGTEGFTGGGDVGARPEFSGRPNLTEERQDMALDPDEAGSLDLDRDS